MPGELLRGREQSLHGDSAYHSKELTAQAVASGLAFKVNQRGTKSRPPNQAQKARNRRSSDVRVIGEFRSGWSAGSRKPRLRDRRGHSQRRSVQPMPSSRRCSQRRAAPASSAGGRARRHRTAAPRRARAHPRSGMSVAPARVTIEPARTLPMNIKSADVGNLVVGYQQLAVVTSVVVRRLAPVPAVKPLHAHAYALVIVPTCQDTENRPASASSRSRKNGSMGSTTPNRAPPRKLP